ncbi:hypothetical protein Q8A67_020212 [Cirrhinus molitorella]|uniref:Uncharacterized protein n=1 Tax=Cirrhinus molitorella TaxID=172907 RepID=A0AA88PBG5_9TELE|nr:hypothetical protein Q8A67_020212 [Cirrhinus molitorella]
MGILIRREKKETAAQRQRRRKHFWQGEFPESESRGWLRCMAAQNAPQEVSASLQKHRREGERWLLCRLRPDGGALMPQMSPEWRAGDKECEEGKCSNGETTIT